MVAFLLQVVTRQSGATAKIRKDVYYHAPDGKKLRSRVEVPSRRFPRVQ
jgi:hypothetical protein